MGSETFNKGFVIISAVCILVSTTTACHRAFESKSVSSAPVTGNPQVQCTENCSEPSEKKIWENKYQVGDRWDRDFILEDQSYTKSILPIDTEFTGNQGQSVFLGNLHGHDLFITVNHVLSEDEDDCDMLVNSKDAYGLISHYCQGFVYSLPELDITFFTMASVRQLKENYFEASTIGPIPNKAEALSIRFRDLKKPFIFTDQGADCTALSDEVRRIPDLDTQNPLDGEYFSQPIGCDAQHGDSGAPVFNKANELVGILWTGKFPKKQFTSDEIKKLVESNNPLLWDEFNHMVPMAVIVEALQAQIDYKKLKDKPLARKILQSFILRAKKDLNLNREK